MADNVKLLLTDVIKLLPVLLRMFSSLSRSSRCGQLIYICNYLVDQGVVLLLTELMNTSDQHIVFMSTKAISSIILYDPSLIKKYNLYELFLDCLNYEWKATYLMKMLTQVVNGMSSQTYQMEKSYVQCKCFKSFTNIGSDFLIHDALFYCGLMIQDSKTIISSYVSSWKDIFTNYLLSNKDYTKYFNCILKTFHSHCEQTRLMVQQGVNERHIEITGKTKQILISFLQFLSAFLKWKVINGLFEEEMYLPGNNGENESTKSREVTELFILIPLFAHILQVHELSIEIWKSVLCLLSACLSTNTSDRFFIVLSRHVVLAVLHLTENGILNNIPLYDGFDCFAGDVLSNPKTNILKPEQPHNGLVCQMSLLIINASLEVISQDDYDSVQLVSGVLNTWISFLIHKTKTNSCKMLLDLFADKDDDMLQMMLLLIKLHNRSSPDNFKVLYALEKVNPHQMFLEFLHIIHFDHTVLLDFLVSNETVFLEYLMFYLQLVLMDWTGFCSIVESYSPLHEEINSHSVQLESGGKYNKSSNGSSLGFLSNIIAAYGSDDSDNGNNHDDLDSDYGDIVVSGINDSVPDNVSDIVSGIGSNCVEDNTMGGSYVVGSIKGCYYSDIYSSNVYNDNNKSIISNTLSSKTNGLPFQSKVERAISPLIHLRISVQRLVKADLFPYNVTPLIRKLESVESCFDGC